MANPSGLEARVAALEARVEEVAADATAARHLAAARDRDLADFAVKIDANRSATNALGVQTAARFDHVDARFRQVDARFDRLEAEMHNGFAEVRAKLDQTTGGLQRIIELLTDHPDR
jgi:outer membrane murein-binding lipoprotein Lpp